jgi:methanogenic corrinoid protein MtbC1
MYTIKQASARIGLPIQTIRVWERRYGVVEPARTAAGYRLYDDAAIIRLTAMRHLVESEGWRPSQAAAHVLAAGDQVGELIPQSSSTSLDGALGGQPRHARSQDAVDNYLAAADLLDVPAMDRILGEAFASQRFESAIDDVVFPSLRAIGDAWASGALDVAQEHVASETVRRRLATFFDAAGQASTLPKILVGLPPGGQHELGALAFAVAGRRAGLDLLYLGANVPVESWLRTARETNASVAVIAVVTADDVAAATLVVESLRTLARPPVCALGGFGAPAIPTGIGVVRLASGMDEAVAELMALQATTKARG